MVTKNKPNVNPSTEAPKDGKQVPQYANVIKNKRDILKQYLIEKDYAIKVRQVKINNWLKNEELYNGVTQRTLLTRSNLHLPIVFEGVQNASSKIGAVPDVEFETIPEGDENASEIMKHVVKEDLDDSEFEIVWEDSKIECGIYGETVYEIIPGNDKQTVELVDTLAFLRSPIAKKSKTTLYCGRQFIYKTIEEIEDEAEEMEYDTEEIQKLKDNKVPNETEQSNSSEASAKNIRLANMGLSNTTQFGSKVAELTKWCTYIKGELYILIVANDLYLLSAKPASDFGLKRPPFIWWGIFSRGIAMLAPSIADIYRDPNLAINVITNQNIDNNTYRNFAEIFVSSSSGLKQSSIVPRPNGVTPITCAPGEKVGDKVWIKEVPEISQGSAMSSIVKGFADSASGLAPNIAPSKGKLSVTQQARLNAEVEQKIIIMKKKATLAFREVCQLMADITASKLTKPRKVKIFGYKDLTIDAVTKANFKDVKLIAKTTPSEDSAQNKAIKQKAKIDLYTLFKDDPKIPGQIAMRRSVAKTFDIPPQEIEDWFTEEKAPKPEVPLMPEENATETPASPDSKPMNDASALLNDTQKTAQSNVPPAIKPTK
ncbi:MAG: hypothetical protein WCO07_01425 [bacterium]